VASKRNTTGMKLEVFHTHVKERNEDEFYFTDIRTKFVSFDSSKIILKTQYGLV
jgi:ribosomal 30S subunit maturation factor RimM